MATLMLAIWCYSCRRLREVLGPFLGLVENLCYLFRVFFRLILSPGFQGFVCYLEVFLPRRAPKDFLSGSEGVYD